MKNRHRALSIALFAVALQPASAMCMGDLLAGYLQNPKGRSAPGTVLAGTQLALVRLIAVHTDRRALAPWQETGTLDLIRIESMGRTLPATFTVPYRKRDPGKDCETWDAFNPKPGERLLAFFRPAGKGWEIPELGAMGIVNDVSRLSPATRRSAQRLFRKRL